MVWAVLPSVLPHELLERATGYGAAAADRAVRFPCGFYGYHTGPSLLRAESLLHRANAPSNEALQAIVPISFIREESPRNARNDRTFVGY